MDLLPFPWLTPFAPCGTGQPVVIASGIRLYRNLHNMPFLEQAGKQEQLAVSEILNRALDQLPDFCDEPEELPPFSRLDCACMLEQRLITPEFAKMQFSGQAIRFTANCTESALLNGGDHLTLCNYGTGLALQPLWTRQNELDNALSRCLRFAFHPKYGYLSPDPEKAGTGMECMVILHLPGLALLDEIKPMLTAFLRLGLKCRGILDAENKFPGNLYVISNRSKMGETEAQLIARMEKTVSHIVDEELDAREHLFWRTPMKVEDFYSRSIAVLKYARMISSVEALNALSGLRFAQDSQLVGVLAMLPADLPSWDELLLWILPNHVKARFPDPEKVTGEQRAVKRAEYLWRAFGGTKNL